jgi:peptidoglycan/xylan/chitin deacetylase (PgdA/CDA1 family)
MEREAGIHSSFFFFAQSGGSRGGRYDSLALKEILRELARNGWETGLHGSFDSMLDQSRLAEERMRLGHALGSDVDGVRQHYLRVRVPDSFRHMEKVGFKYDASIGFSDRLGFRSSMCLPYRPYDLVDRKALDILEIPLVVMDGALPDSDDARRKAMMELAGTVRKERGLLSILWHQRSFSEDDFPGIGSLYEWFLNRIADEDACVAPHGEIFRWWQAREGLALQGLEQGDRRITASFSSPCDTPAMTFELAGRYRVLEADGAAMECIADSGEGHRAFSLSNIGKEGFELVLEEALDEQ